jgi:hypothetical protein
MARHTDGVAALGDWERNLATHLPLAIGRFLSPIATADDYLSSTTPAAGQASRSAGSKRRRILGSLPPRREMFACSAVVANGDG